MSTYRDHDPVTIDQFNGLWARGDVDNTPLDHFADCNNVKYIGSNSVKSRPGIGISQDVAVPLANVKRIYNYPTETANTFIVLVQNSDGDGVIYHVVTSTLVYGPLLTITGMTDFAFVPYAGRAYISPFGTFNTNGINVDKGLDGEFLYVYAGDGTAARKAAGSALSGTMTVANGAAGHTDAGRKIFAFVVETESGYLTAPGLNTQFVTAAGSSVSFTSVDVGGATAVKRHLVATKTIVGPFNGDLNGYTFYFVPDATIDDNTTTTLSNISFYDADLLDDASHLIDNYAEISAGAVLTIYHNRLILGTTFDDINICLVSAVGEPEAISQIDGLITITPDGNPITNAQELRDVLYVTKRSMTGSFIDNQDVPTAWPYVTVDVALGTSVHGINSVLNTAGSSSVDFLIICTYQGVMLFNGRYITPELSWKIEDYWRNLERNDFHYIQIVNSPVAKEIYIVLPTRQMMVGNYGNGMDPKKIRWGPYSFACGVNTICIANTDEVVIGADLGGI
jgi:hypothetical protein